QKYHQIEVPMRGWARPERWMPVIFFLGGFYLFLLALSQFGDGISPLQMLPQRTKLKSDYDYAEGVTVKKFTLILNSTRYETMEIENILTNDKSATFEERLHANVDYKAPPKIILSWDAGHGPENLGGCPDWNCEFTYDRSKVEKASVVLATSDGFTRRNRDQIIVFYSQESPKNMPINVNPKDYFNVSLGFRHDTAGASPYGYTVKLAKRRNIKEMVNSSRLKGKSKAAAWFVSHCFTNSKREDLVVQMQKYIPVDIFGGCLQGKSCPRGEKCEDMLDEDYHFYLAFENSICTDYITEKVWNQGYGRDIVPIVMKRSVADNRLPPNSFLAIDDYDTVQDLAERMKFLMNNKTAYSQKIKDHSCSEMFNWRRDYATIYLNGEQHDILERPWGFCQLCRIAWENPKTEQVIDDFNKWWEGSCEEDGATVARILSHTEARENEKEHMIRANRITV
ncbi:hypothetical protein PENTCL1PPCAC_5961, partial [Pristionchus entomophagus]